MSLSIPPENIRKYLVFRCFQGVWEDASDMKWVNALFPKHKSKDLWQSLWITLKLVSAIFYFFTKWQPFKNYEKCFLFHWKSSSHSRDIQIFVFRSSPLFLLVSYCFRGWSKINLKAYDIINCLNKNLITHFVWYLEKEKKYDIETLSIDRILDKEHLYGKIIHKMCSKS